MDRVNKLHFPFRRVHPQLPVICLMPTFRAAGTPVPTEISILRRDSEGWKRFLREKQGEKQAVRQSNSLTRRLARVRSAHLNCRGSDGRLAASVSRRLQRTLRLTSAGQAASTPSMSSRT
jgi:hypothetical protein